LTYTSILIYNAINKKTSKRRERTVTDRSGQQLGNYRIIRLLGTGGFADVYLGEHIFLKTPVAIKVLQARISAQDDLDSFLKEAQMVARLIHPHIVRVTDFGIADSVPFLVMDYAPGGTLRARHPKGSQLPVATLVPYVQQVAEALQYAHIQKIVHRDIKPENMLISTHNDILLSDFGIALISQSSRYQGTQDVTGTVAYMSPEQIQGKPVRASDQYSLAITVYEWLSGERPFHGSFTELCVQHMFASPPPLHEKVPSISPDVEQVVMTALAKDSKQRFGSIQAFATALAQAAGHPSQPLAQPKEDIEKQPQHELPPTIIDLEAPQPLIPPPPPIKVEQKIPEPLELPKPAIAEVKHHEKASLIPPPPPDVIAASPGIAPAPAKQEKLRAEKPFNAWGFGRRQIIATVTGTILYIAAYNLNIPMFSTSFSPGWLVSVFMSAIFGPWVGLVIGGLGSIGGQALFFHSFLIWTTIGEALIGIAPGLFISATKGRYRSFGSAFGIGLVSATAFCSGVIIAFIPNFSFLTNVLGYIAINAIGILILLPILLLIYDRTAYRKERI
jgi:serine/threonine protein kinase